MRLFKYLSCYGFLWNINSSIQRILPHPGTYRSLDRSQLGFLDGGGRGNEKLTSSGLGRETYEGLKGSVRFPHSLPFAQLKINSENINSENVQKVDWSDNGIRQSSAITSRPGSNSRHIIMMEKSQLATNTSAGKIAVPSSAAASINKGETQSIMENEVEPDKNKIEHNNVANPAEKLFQALVNTMAKNWHSSQLRNTDPKGSPKKRYLPESHSIMNEDGTITKIAEDDVLLFLYDLSGGRLAYYTSIILKEKMEAIWHSSVVAFGKEYYFGTRGVIECDTIGQPDTVEPLDIIFMGKTTKNKREFERYLEDLDKKQFSKGRYNLLTHNCHAFSDEVCLTLTGRDMVKPNEKNSRSFSRRPRTEGSSTVTKKSTGTVKSK